MQRPEVDDTDTAIHTTFGAHPQDIYSTTMKGASMLIEPFDLPGTVITNNLTLSAQKGSDSLFNTDSLFNIVPGLDGNPNSVSLELGDRRGLLCGDEDSGQLQEFSSEHWWDTRAGGKLCADFPAEAVPSNQLCRKESEEELRPGATLQFQGRILHGLLQHWGLSPQICTWSRNNTE
uniref:Uncharacterized protein n=1 Tax=Setaria viridis TaxID=4556 RepID=A0A4U6W4M8_SETVI|nr:hypothetical protein SEVIR_1G036326v2 [Setaria viridis]